MSDTTPQVPAEAWPFVREPAAAAAAETAAYRPFPLDALPAVMSRFAAEVARTICVDPALAVLPMLSVAGAAIGNTARARMSPDYLAPAVIWAAPVTRSGERKSPVLRAVMRPIYEAQTDAARGHAQAMAEFKQDAARRKALPRADRADAPCEPPPYPHLYLSDATTEAIALRLAEQPRGLIVAMDELAALFGGMNQYKSRGNDRESYLAFYDAAAAKIDRKTSSPPTIYIPRAFVAVTGMIQPGTLARCLGAAEFDSGLAARFMLAAPPPVRAVWSDKAMSESAREGWRELIESLLNHPLPPTPALLPPSDAAMSLWAKVHDRLEAERHREPDDRMRAARSKLIGLIPRLSLVFQMVSAASGEGHALVKGIDSTSMERAIAVVEWATQETRRVYALLAAAGADGGGDGDEQVIRSIEGRGGRISPRELMRCFRRFRSSAARAREFLDSMVQDGIGHWELLPTAGRTGSVFVLDRPVGGDTSPLPGGARGDTSPVSEAPRASVTVTTVTARKKEVCDGF